MRKKIFVIALLFSLLFISTSPVYAQSSVFPKRLVALEYSDYYLLQENAYTFEYMVSFYLDYLTDYDDTNFIFVNDMNEVFRYGLNRNTNSIEYSEHVAERDKTRYKFVFTLKKSLVDSINGDIDGFFSNHSVMYIESYYTDPNNVMGNFLGIELSGFPQENDISGELWHTYFAVDVYLPDGSKEDLAEVGHLIRANSSVFDGYDFVAFVFNLSPRAVFRSSSISPQINGLAYIVYDIVGYRTLFYNHAGQVVYSVDRILDIVNPQVRVPASDDMNYREQLAYERGLGDGIEVGREQAFDEGYNEGYKEGYNSGYRKGKNEGVMERLDLFGYLQALFGEQGLGRLLKLELLPGVSLGAVIMIPLAFWLVSFIMRWFR